MLDGANGFDNRIMMEKRAMPMMEEMEMDMAPPMAAMEGGAVYDMAEDENDDEPLLGAAGEAP